MALEELHRLMDEETMLYKDIKTQYVDCKNKKVVVCSSNQDFLLPLLYDLYAGNLYGHQTVIDVTILVEEEKIQSLELLYCNNVTSGLPMFKDLAITSLVSSMKNVDVVVIHPDITWESRDTVKTRKEVLCEQFLLLRKLGLGISKYLPHESTVILIGECLSPIRFILGLYAINFPHEHIHGVTRHYERQAAAMISTKLKLPMREVKGIAVFGEDIVETTNGWVEYNEEDLEDEVYEDSIMYYKHDIYELVKMNEQRRSNIIEKLTGRKNIGMIDIPDISNLHFCDVQEPMPIPSTTDIEEEFEMKDKDAYNNEFLDEQFEEELGEHCELSPTSLSESPDINVHDFEMGDNQKFTKDKWSENELEAWLKERFPDRERKIVDKFEEIRKDPLTISERFRLTWGRHWFAKIAIGCHDLPKEWNIDNCMTKYLHQKPPVRGPKWIIRRIDDEKFLMYTVPCKAKEVQNGYTLARAVIDYLQLLQKQSSKRTSSLVCSPGIYDVAPGIFFSFPTIIDKENRSSIIEGYDISEATSLRIRKQSKVLENEYELVLKLFQEFPPEEKQEPTTMKKCPEEEEDIPGEGIYNEINSEFIREQVEASISQ